MALEKNKIISNDALNVPLEMAENMDTLLLKLKETIQTLGVLNQSFSKNPGVKESKKNTDELTNSQKELAKVFKQIETAQARLTPEYDKQNKKLIELRTAQAQRNKQLRDEAKAAQQNLGPLEQLNQKRLQAQTRLKNLIAAEELHGRATKRSTQEIKLAQVEFNKLDKSFIRVQRSARQFGDNVGNYPKMLGSATNALKGFLGAFGLLGGMALFVRTLKAAADMTMEYVKVNANLRGILRQTKEETEGLSKQQLELGASTEFSANQVASAQLELAKLGKTNQEIINMTPGILAAATAMGAELAPSAALVAGQLNAFQLASTESERVADILAKSTQISALNFERLETALGVVSPAAKAVNASLETTLATLSAAIDANIDASTAATGLRNIYIDLADKGISWEEAMTMINTSTNKLSKANELFGKRGAVVATVIAENTEKIDRNTKSLENAAGTAQRFREEQLNNLQGDIILLTSAWEGFVLGIENGDGALAKFIRGSLQLFTRILGKLTPELAKQSTEIEKQRNGLNNLVKAITNTNDNEDLRGRLIEKLNQQYPEFIKNIDTETASNDELIKRLEEVNKQMEKKILIQLKEEKLKPLFEERARLMIAETEAVSKLAGEIIGVEEAQKRLDNAYKTGDATIIERAKKIRDLNMTVDLSRTFTKTLDDQIKELQESYDNIIDTEEDFSKVTGRTNTALQAFANSIDGMNRKEIDDLLFKLEQTKAATQVAFDKTGAENLKAELEELGGKINIAKNQIQAFADTSLQLSEIQEGIKQKEIEINERIKLEQRLADAVSATTIDSARERLRIEMDASSELFAFKERELERQLKIQNLTLDQEKKISDELQKLRIDRNSEVESQIRKNVQLEIDAANEIVGEKQRILENEIANLQTAFSKGEITRDQYNQRIFDLEKIHADEMYDVQANALLDILSLEEITAEERADALKNLHDLRIQYAEDGFNREVEIDAERRRLNQAYTDFAVENINSVSNHLFEAQKTRLNNEIESTREGFQIQFESLERQIQNEEEGSQRRAALEERLAEKKEQLAKKEREAKQRMAKLEKAQQIANITINTAGSIIKTASTMGFPAAIPFIALAAATGAIQKALVLSTPIPQYESGIKDSAPTFIAGEGKGGKAFELVKNNKGTFLTKGPTLFKDMPHSTVYNHEDTLKILNSSLMSGLMINESQGTYQDAELRRDLNKGFSKVAKEIRKKPTMIVSGVVGKQVSGTRINKLNALRGL